MICVIIYIHHNLYKEYRYMWVRMDTIDWFQIILCTRVLVNITKMIQKSPILRCTFSPSISGIFEKSSALHPAPFQKYGRIIKNTLFPQRNVHNHFVIFLGLVPTQKINLCLCSDLTFSFILVYTIVRQVINYI